MEKFLMVLKLFFILCSSETICSMEREHGFQALIMGGDRLKIEDAPYYAALINCGAVIISRTWVLTAAHCVEEPLPRYYRYVWVGGESFDTSQRVPYNKVIMYEGFIHNFMLPVHDIALIRLASPLQFTKKIQPIKLPMGVGEYRKLMVVGRGIDETGNDSEYLKKLDLIRSPIKECISSLVPKEYHFMLRPYWEFLEMTTICAKKGQDEPSICDGDSGGPLVSGGDTLVGLVSYMDRIECHEARRGFFVNVTSYLPWIKEHTGL